MSKINYKNMMLIIAVAVLCAFCLIGCGGDTNNTNKLAAPENLKITNEVLEWDGVENADGYFVAINEEKYETQTNSLDIFLLAVTPNTYVIRVMAYSNSDKYTSSEWSENVEYTVSQPLGIGLRLINTNNEYEITVLDKTIVEGKIVLPSTYQNKPVTQISKAAFIDCAKLTDIIIPDSVIAIGNEAFSNCTNLTRVRLPKYLKTIESSTFSGCKSLIEIDLPQSVEAIKNDAFSGCKSLSSMRIPKTTESIGLIFEYCDSLNSIIIEDDNPIYMSDGNCIIRKADNAVVVGCNSSVIPNYVNSIEQFAFYASPNLVEITIPSSVTVIKRYAFGFCTSLTKLDVIDGIEKIGEQNSDKVFYGCTALERVTLPRTLIYISSSAFIKCSSLKSISVDERNETYKSDGECVIRKADNEIVMGCSNSVIPDYVQSIGEYAFSETLYLRIEARPTYLDIDNCDNDTLYLPQGMRVIKAYAFSSCINLKYITFPKSIYAIEKFAFEHCDSLMSITCCDGLLVVGKGAFCNAMVYTASVDIPKDWNVDNAVFLNCSLGEDHGQYYVKSFTAVSRQLEDGTIETTLRPASYLQIPYRKGYEFKGWAMNDDDYAIAYPVRYHEKDIGNPYEFYYAIDFNDLLSFNMKDGTKLYAVWAAI